jgi:release factor glutamine methyltransferase
MTDLADRRDLDTDVYQPAEDSHLLATTAVDYAIDGDRVVDVGTGSGYVAAHVAAETGADVIGTDVNPHACRSAAERGVPAIRGDLVAPIRDGVADLITFNPPYLPTAPETERDDWVERALSGGESGRAVIDPFLGAVPRVLAPGGRAAVLVSTLADVDAALDTARDAGLDGDIVAEESFPFETLCVLVLSTDN